MLQSTRTRVIRFSCAAIVLGAGMMLASAAGPPPERSARQADLDAARQKYVDRAPSFSPGARTRASEWISSLRAQADAMTDAQFVLALARIAAFADNGHDAYDLGDGAWTPALRLPVRMIWFPDALIIARTAREQADLLGASVVSVEGLTPAQLLERLRPLQGGTDTYRRWQMNWIFHSPEALNALGIAHASDRLDVRLKLKDGNTVDRTLNARPKTEMPAGQQPSRYWIPTPLPGEAEKGWRSAIDPSQAPLYLQEGDKWFRVMPMNELDALYVQFRSNMDEDDAKIGPFVKEVSQRLKKTPPRNIIVDLRFDTGGDNTKNRGLMKQIAKAVPGRIYLMVGNYTFSAGIATAAALAHDGGARVTIAGSELGDRMHWWSEHGENVCLPASKVCFSLNTGYWDIVNGCKSNPRCYGDQFDLNVPSLEPALPAPLLSTDWLANRDPALEAIAANLKKLRN